jgi:hypothetical protein
MFGKLSVILVCCTMCLSLAYCDKGSGKEAQKPKVAKVPVVKEPSAAQDPAPAAPIAVLEGVVRLEKGAKLPSYPPQMMMRQVLNLTEPAPMPKECSPAQDADRQPVQLTEQGALAGVMIAVTGFSRFNKRPSVTHDVVIEDCRLRPMFVVAEKDDMIRIRSTTNYPFMPGFGTSNITQTLIKGQEDVIRLDRGGVQTLLCGFTAPCGRTDVVVLHHSLYTLTDAQGAFRLENVPAGETITVNAWHPLFRETNINLSVQPNEVRQVPLTLSPSPAYTTRPANKSPTRRGVVKGRAKHSPPDPTILR